MAIDFAPWIVWQPQDSEGRGGRHCPSPPTDLERRLVRRFATSCSIGKSLPLCAFDGAIGALQIVNAEGDAVVMPKIEFGGIAMQVSLADMEIAAVNSTLQDREIIFDRVGVPEVSADVFLGAEVDGAVAGERFANSWVDQTLVRHQVTRLVDLRDDDGLEERGGDVRD